MAKRKKLEEIEKMFSSETCGRPACWRSENDPNKLVIRCCALGAGWDYGDEPNYKIDPKYEFLKNDPRIIILWCDDCYGCGGW